MFTSFINNFTLLFTASFVYSYIISVAPQNTLLRKIITGILFGVIAVIGMSVPYEFAPGIIFDQRTVIISICGLFGGPVSTIITVVFASRYRIILGGTGMLTGVLNIISAAVIGLSFYYALRRSGLKINIFILTIMGVIVHVALLALMLTLPGNTGYTIIYTLGPSIMLVFTFSTVVIGLVLRDMEVKQEHAEGIKISEHKYRVLFESMTQGVTYQNRRGEILSANHAALEILGLSLDQLQGKTSFDPGWRSIAENGEEFPGDKHPSMVALKTGKPVKNVIMGVYNPKEKSMRWIKIDSAPQFRAGDTLPYQVFTIFEDITSIKNKETLLRGTLQRVEKNELLLKEAERIAKIGAWEYDAATGAIEWSDGSFNLYELPYGKVPPFEEILSFYKVEYRSQITSAMEECIKNNKNYELEIEIVSHTGREKWIRAIGRGIADDRGKVMRIIGIIQDITESKTSAQKIEESEKQYRLLADNTRDIIVLLDEHLMYQYISPSVYYTRGFKSEELIDTEYPLYVHPEDRQEVISWLQKQINGEMGGESHNYRISHKTGGYIWVEVKSQPIVNEKSGKINIILSKREITARIEAIKKLQESETRYKTLFENQPTIIWEEDFSAVKTRLMELAASAVSDLRSHLEQNEDEMNNIASLVKIIQMNEASKEILEAESLEDIIRNLPYYFDSSEAWDVFREEVLTLWDGGKFFEAEIPVKTLKGNHRWLFLKLIIPDEYVNTWERVLVSFLDITDLKKSHDELLKSEEKFKNYFQNSTEGIYVGEFDEPIDVSLPVEEQIDLMYRNVYIADCNDAFAKIYGLEKAADAIGMRQTDAHGDEMNETNREFLRKLAVSGYSVKGIITEEVDVQNNKIYISNNTSGEIENGKLTRIWASQIDVTDKVLKEKKLAESEEKYRSLVETSHDLIWTVNADGVITFINNASKYIYGYEPEELIGKTFYEVIPKEQHEQYVKNVSNLINRPTDMLQLEGEYKRKDGKIVYLLSNYRIHRNEKGEILGLTGSSKDITDSVVVREQLLANQVRLENAKNIARLGYWELNLKTDELYWSDEVYQIFGFTKIESGLNFERFISAIHPEDREKMEAAQALALAGKEKLNLIHRIVLNTGEVKYLHERGELQYNSDFIPIKLSGTVQDITELKLIEEELREKAKELEESRKKIRELSVYQNELREEERKSIAREIHDELGQILTSVKMNLSMLNQKITSPELSINPESLSNELNMLMGKMDGSVVKVRDIIRRLRPEFLDSLGLIPALEYHIEEFEMQTGIACTFINATNLNKVPDFLVTDIFRIIQEALTNISRHSGAKTALVELSQKNNYILLRIIDNGKGINQHKEKKRTFGLIGMKERTESLNGTFALQSSPGNGTVIEIRFPLQTIN